MTSTRAAVSAGPSSVEAGRVPGLRPPLPAWASLTWFAAMGALPVVVVVLLVHPPGALDQPDPAYQRDGLLLSGPVVPDEVVGVEFGARPVVLLFLREPPAPAALAEWASAVPETAEVAVVLPQPTSVELPVPTVVDPLDPLDPLDRLAEIVGMPTPVDGGRPVGYAVVDSDRVVRYATLDPACLTNAFEVTTILGAVT